MENNIANEIKFHKKTDQEVADEMIKIMQEFGLTPDDMIRVIRLAKQKFLLIKNSEKNGNKRFNNK